MVSADMEHRVNQLRHDVDDVYELLAVTNKTVEETNGKVVAIATTQRRHGNRLDEIQCSLDLTVGRLERLEQGHERLEQRQLTQDAKLDAIEQRQQTQDAKLDAILAAVGGRPPVDGRRPGQEASVDSGGGSAV